MAGETLSRGALELELDHLSQGKHHLQAPARLPRPPHPPPLPLSPSTPAATLVSALSNRVFSGGSALLSSESISLLNPFLASRPVTCAVAYSDGKKRIVRWDSAVRSLTRPFRDYSRRFSSTGL